MLRSTLSRMRPRSAFDVMAALSLFLVLTGGSAIALSGTNTVFSDDITNDEVRSVDVRDDTLENGGLAAPDLRTGAIRSAEVLDDTARGGGLTDRDLREGSVGSSEVMDNALTGWDIDEPSLGEVPYADQANWTPYAWNADRAGEAEDARRATAGGMMIRWTGMWGKTWEVGHQIHLTVHCSSNNLRLGTFTDGPAGNVHWIFQRTDTSGPFIGGHGIRTREWETPFLNWSVRAPMRFGGQAILESDHDGGEVVAVTLNGYADPGDLSSQVDDYCELYGVAVRGW